MRCAIVFLLLVSCAAATSFTLYDKGSFIYDGKNISATLFLGDDANLQPAALAYSSIKKSNGSQAQQDAARNATLSELAAAKADDRVALRSEDGGFVLSLGECKDFAQATYCFTTVTYYEEDADPLGDGRLDSVKVVDGDLSLPFTITASTKAGPSLTAVRKFSPAKPYVGDKVSVGITFTNTGSEVAGRLAAQEQSPLLVIAGTTSFSVATINPGESNSFNYTVQPDAVGEYRFSGVLTTSNNVTLPDSNLTVKEAINASLLINNTIIEEETPFTLVVNNLYSADLPISVTVRTQGRFTEPLTDGTMRADTSTLKTTIPKGGNKTLTAAIMPLLAGTNTLSYEITYETGDTLVISGETQYEVVAKELFAQPSVDGSLVTLHITNTGNDATDVLFDFGESKTRLPVVRTGDQKSVQHEFKNAGKHIITISYDIFKDHRVKSLVVDTGGYAQQTTPQGYTNQPSAQNPGTQPAENTGQPVTGPREPTIGEPEQVRPKDDRSLLKKALDWIAGLFS